MPKFHVATEAELIRLQVAIDQAEGTRDVQGNPTPKEQLVHAPWLGGYVPASVVGVPAFDMPGRHTPIIVGDDGTAAMLVPEDFWAVTDNLGKTLPGNVKVPRLKDLVSCPKAKDYSKLPAGVMRKLDDAALAGLEITQADVDDGSNLPIETRAALVQKLGEFEGDTARIKAALSRKEGKAAVEGALGLTTKAEKQLSKFVR
jgi:hypothetical protein